MLQIFVATGSSHISNRHLSLKQNLGGMLDPSFNNIFVQRGAEAVGVYMLQIGHADV